MPVNDDDSNQNSNGGVNAADMIRQKINHIRDEEPNAKLEAQEANMVYPGSKHQQFMRSLTSSGKDIATIQTEWHKYYLSLSEKDKHQVWREFYASNQALHQKPAQTTNGHGFAQLKNEVTSIQHYQAKPANSNLTTAKISRNIRSKVTAGGKLKAKHHLQSLLFGLSMGALVIIIFLFSFFNEVFIAPFIQPGRASAVPIIIGSSSIAATSTPQVIIPKINVQIPVDYSETSTNESAIENDLEAGVVHYPTTVLPGQLGNAAFFGHSSNNIFNPGKYKFAFVLLHTLVDGDTFYLTYNNTVYVYKVISTNIVSPSDVSVLNSVAGQTATATLITCDPPGTSINRLVVVGQQISPDPSSNTAPAKTVNATSVISVLPNDGPTLWDRYIGTTYGKVVTGAFGFFIVGVALRQLNKKRY